MSDAAVPAPGSNGTNGKKKPEDDEELEDMLVMFTEAELDAREAALDAVLDRIDEVLPQARARVRQQQQDPGSSVFMLRQIKRTKVAFFAMRKAADDVRHQSGEIVRPVFPEEEPEEEPT